MSGIELVAADRFPHGSRARYVKGCRCEPCTIANRLYAKSRYRAQARARAIDASGSSTKSMIESVRGDLVPADRAKRHLRELSKQGVGYKAAADAAGVGRTLVSNIVQGYQRHVRRYVESAILGVTRESLAPGALVKSGKVQRAVRELQALGMTRAAVALELGYVRGAVQFDRTERVRRSTEVAVLALLDKVRFQRSRVGQRVTTELCADCGLSHLEAFRRRELATYTPEEIADLPNTWPCLYSGETGAEILRGDLASIGRAP